MRKLSVDARANRKETIRSRRNVFLFSAVLFWVLLSTSCLKLDVSPFDSSRGEAGGWIGALVSDRSVTECRTFYAYPNGSKNYYHYSTCNPTWQISSYTGTTNPLKHVARTGAGFVGLDGTTTIWRSTDGVSWNSTGNTVSTASNALIAACGNQVVTASTDGAGASIETKKSADGGISFSAASGNVLSGTTLKDLICVSNVFHISGGSGTLVTYKKSGDFGNSWNSPTTNPNTFSIPVTALWVSGSTILAYYQNTSMALTRSLDGGANWTDYYSSNYITGTYSGAITFTSGSFFAPYVNGSGFCVTHRSSDNGTTWDDSRTIFCSAVAQLLRARATGGTIVAVGQDNGTPLLIQSTDGGTTLSQPTLPAGGAGAIQELIVF